MNFFFNVHRRGLLGHVGNMRGGDPFSIIKKWDAKVKRGKES